MTLFDERFSPTQYGALSFLTLLYVFQGIKASIDSQKKQKKEDPAWLANKIKPQGDLTKPRMHRNKAWYWCSLETGGKCSGAWHRHKPSMCKGWAPVQIKQRKADDLPPSDGPVTGDKMKLKLNQAYQALLNKVESN